jgi:hypothetical protein
MNLGPSRSLKNLAVDGSVKSSVGEPNQDSVKSRLMDSNKRETQPMVVVDPQLERKRSRLITTSWLSTVTVPAFGVKREDGETEYE